MKTKKMKLIVLSTLLFALTIIGCKNEKKESKEIETVVEVVEEPIIVEDIVWIIDESKINDINLVSDEKGADRKVISNEDLGSALGAQDYIADNEIEVTEAIIPLDETQTLVSYNKKGKPKHGLQVVSSLEDGEIQQIIFMDRRHKDVYNVQAGMSAKEVKKLRRKVKHMIKHGKVFLYDDSSNIMYLLDAEGKDGAELTEAEIDNLDVQAIIWKDN